MRAVLRSTVVMTTALGLVLTLFAGPVAANPVDGVNSEAAENSVAMPAPPEPPSPGSTATADRAAVDPAQPEFRTVISAPKDLDWLRHINLYREGSGLKPVVNQPAWSAAIVKHARYLVLTSEALKAYPYDAHNENPQSKHYRPDGAEAGRSSNVIESSYSMNTVDAIDGWLSAPYHAFAMLNPDLKKVAYGEYYNAKGASRWSWAAGLNVISGVTWDASKITQPVLFPGPGMTTDMSNFSGNERPDPLKKCGGEWEALDGSVGLPLIAINTTGFSSKLTATVKSSTGKVVADSQKGTLCVVKDQRNDQHAVFLIAKKAYKKGYYTATIKQPGKATISWTFGVKTAKPRLGCAGFPDVAASAGFCTHISWFADQGITKPVNGLYGPSNDVNRGSMVAFLYRMLNPGKPQPKCTETPFPDVSQTHRFCGYIQWADSAGIAKGYPDGTYRPENSVTRGAMSAFLYRIAGPDGRAKKCTEQPYVDVKTNDTFCGTITWMKTTKITSGVGGGDNYGTKQDVSRAQMAAFLYRL